jgi:catalase
LQAHPGDRRWRRAHREASATLASGEQDPGVLVFGEGEARKALPRFIAAIARHRHFERELDPPPV